MHVARAEAEALVHAPRLVGRAEQHTALAADRAPVVTDRAHQLRRHALAPPLGLDEDAPARADALVRGGHRARPQLARGRPDDLAVVVRHGHEGLVLQLRAGDVLIIFSIWLPSARRRSPVAEPPSAVTITSSRSGPAASVYSQDPFRTGLGSEVFLIASLVTRAAISWSSGTRPRYPLRRPQTEMADGLTACSASRARKLAGRARWSAPRGSVQDRAATTCRLRLGGILLMAAVPLPMVGAA